MNRFVVVSGAVAIVLAAGIVAVASSQPPQAHAPWSSMHEACSESGDTRSGHLPAHLTEMLRLSDAQIAEIDRVGAEACRQMAAIHAQMLDVLTPEQRARFEQMHGGDHAHGAIASWMKKLHGGRSAAPAAGALTAR